jgi:hypothetical protein
MQHSHSPQSHHIDEPNLQQSIPRDSRPHISCHPDSMTISSDASCLALIIYNIGEQHREDLLESPDVFISNAYSSCMRSKSFVSQSGRGRGVDVALYRGYLPGTSLENRLLDGLSFELADTKLNL